MRPVPGVRGQLHGLHAEFAILDWQDTGARNLALKWHDGAITQAVGGDVQPEGRGLLCMPALSNAHDHGRGVRPLAYGVADQALELWSCALSLPPPVDPYLNALVAFARMARSGAGLINHCHMATDPARLIEQTVAVAAAAETLGVRIAIAVPMRDRHRLGYFDDEATIACLKSEHRDSARRLYTRTKVPPHEQVEAVEEISRRCASSLVSVQFAPAAPQWCSDKLLETVAEASARTGRRVHMHCLETRLQREFADAHYGGGLIAFLDAIGLLSPRLTLAHGVWLREDEMAMLAERGVTVSINTSSNLRLRSGIAPACRMLKSGMTIALGMDGLGLDDVEDALRELRLAYLLHAGVSLDEGASKKSLLEAMLLNGARSVTGLDKHGRLEPGYPADVLVLDYARMTDDLMPDAQTPLDMIFARGSSRYVRDLFVAGRPVVADGRIVSIDIEAAERELNDQNKANSRLLAERRPLIASIQDCVRAGYRSGRHSNASGMPPRLRRHPQS